jgi:hypothetical protein
MGLCHINRGGGTVRPICGAGRKPDVSRRGGREPLAVMCITSRAKFPHRRWTTGWRRQGTWQQDPAPLMTAAGCTRLFRAGASHDSSTPNTGSQLPNIGLIHGCFRFTPDCGPSSAGAFTARYDPEPPFAVLVAAS